MVKQDLNMDNLMVRFVNLMKISQLAVILQSVRVVSVTLTWIVIVDAQFFKGQDGHWVWQKPGILEEQKT